MFLKLYCTYKKKGQNIFNNAILFKKVCIKKSSTNLC